ncbi:MAG: hypothetical protein JSV23_03890 [Promethearchaeota archaeon]|nr:MAG: hypothetical protein JSV23_03890 [Candidatus Lokiarchaeota archaeon]
MRVYISDISVIEDKKYGGVTFKITGQLQSGLEIKIKDLFYDLQEYIGRYVEMLLCVFRNPYAEHKMGMINQPFLSEEYYSIELIDELLEKKGFNSKANKKRIILTGEYIDSYVIPEKWIPLMEPKWFRRILKEPSAIKTDDGIFLFYPFHMRKRVSIESFPKNVTIVTGSIDLAAWHPISESKGD